MSTSGQMKGDGEGKAGDKEDSMCKSLYSFIWPVWDDGGAARRDNAGEAGPS